MKQLFVLTAVLFFAVSCKKTTPPVKEEIPEPTLPQNVFSKYDALFNSSRHYVRVSQTFTTSFFETYAYFSSQPIFNEAYLTTNLLNVGDILINDIRLKNRNGSQKFYYEDSTAQNHSALKWKLTGGSKIDSFSFVNTKPYPEFNYQKLPDTISLSKPLTLYVGKVKNCSLIRLFMSAGVNFINKFVPGSDTIINISADELKELPTSETGMYALSFYNDNHWNINSKTINFRTTSVYRSDGIKFRP